MSEKDPYLSQIFGEDALQINILKGVHTLYGEVNQKAVVPLQHVEFGNNGMVCLTISDEHTSGHFTGPKTFPAYRMLELGALVGGRVKQVTNASFNKIVTPGDKLKAFVEPNKHVAILRRNNGTMQEVANASMLFDEQGLLPHELGTTLEIAAQTTVANMAQNMPEMQGLYPIMLEVGSINVQHSQLTTYLTARPTGVEQIDDNMFKASADIKSDSDFTVARVEDMVFKLATERRIHIYNSLGRSE